MGFLGKMVEERRNLLRWPVNWPAKIRIKFKNSNKNFSCQIRDINFKGFLVSLKEKFPSNETLRMAIFFSEDIVLPFKARVNTHESLADGTHIYSFRFVEIKDSDKELIYKLINSNFFPELVKLWWKDSPRKQLNKESGNEAKI